MTNKAPRIYVVEDDPLMAMDIQRSLTAAGFEVIGSSDTAEDAVSKIQETKPNLVLMDIQLRGKMDGIEAASIIGRQQSVPVIFLTGFTDEETLRRAKLAMPYAYLVKPFDPTELATMVDLTLARADHSSQEELVEPGEVNLEGLNGDTKSKAEALSRLSFFHSIASDLLAQIAEASSIRALDAGDFIVDEEEEAQGGFIILAGKIGITKTSAAGKELIVSLLGAGDTFGMLYFMKGFGGCCSARAQVASKILWIPRHLFAVLEERYPPLFKLLAEDLARRLSSAYELASSLAHSRVEDRIVTTLLALLPRLGHGTKNSPSGLRLFMTRRELADLTGTTPETAIRVTKSLERDGLLDLSRPGIIKLVNVQGLCDLIAS